MKIAFASGKGGTGKTLVSTNVFYSLQAAGISVSLVDCDAEEPNVGEFIHGELFNSSSIRQNTPVIDPEKCTFCFKCYDYCNYHAIVCLPSSHFIQVVEDLCHDCGACLFACEYGAITEKEKEIGTINTHIAGPRIKVIEGRAKIGVYSPVPIIRQALNTLSDESIAILDSPPGISCPFIVSVEKADFVVLVTEPTPFGLNDLKLSVATLEFFDKPFGVIINRAGLGNREIYDWIDHKKIPILMEIPFDKEIARIYSEGKLLAEQQSIYQLYFMQLVEKIKNLLP